MSAQILFPTTEIGGYVSIANTLRADTENQTDPTIQPTTTHFKQATGTGNSERKHSPIGVLNICIDVPISVWNIDSHTGMNPQGPIVTMIPGSNRSNDYDIFDMVIRTSDLAYRSSACHGTIKSEIKPSGKP